MTFRLRLAAALPCLVLGLIAGPLVAQASETFPSKPIRIIAPSSPGGILDQTSRLIAQRLSERLKQPVLVENFAGAGGTLGMQAMLRAEADGHTLVMGSLGPNAANYALQDKLPYVFEDFAPVVQVLSMPDVLVVNPKLPVKSIADLQALARSKPGGLSMAVSTSGSSGHLAGELLKMRADIPAVNVVYRGASPALTDLVAGQVDFMVDNLITALPLIRAGKLKAIAVTTRERSPELPGTPTVIESGYADFDVTVWLGLFASAKTSRAIVQQLNTELNEVLAQGDTRQKFAAQGGKPVGGSSADFDRFVRAERQRWAQVIKAGNIKPD